MRRHTSNEGWQAMSGLCSGGYKLYGHGLDDSNVEVDSILTESNADVVVVQDKKEWDAKPKDFREERARFVGIAQLANRSDIFRVTAIRDAQHKPQYHSEAAEEMGAHAWIAFYHPRIVNHLAPYTRPNHIIRTYNTVDPSEVPDFSPDKSGAILSGAMNRKVYPLRNNLLAWHKDFPDVSCIKHPGYHRDGSNTPEYLKTISKHKVAFCTCSIYGYALRKIIEATACGCRVITDLPEDEVLPEIDGNLIRMHPTATKENVRKILAWSVLSYDPSEQKHFAEKAIQFYDYRQVGRRLACDIEKLRSEY